ncbi:unnamed protein product [Rotaria sp. Silwood1]|nr:unnamed protein product [Rotaria sp. Silwood1]CAF1686841.1 unnamed protein product [Rotaria sp. Silwood1]
MVYNELPSVLNDNQRQNYLKVSYVQLEQLTKYLKHFHDVIEKLSCENTPTIHLVIPYKQLLINRSNENDDDHYDLVQLKRFISKHLQDYWCIHNIHYVAMLLHPNLKSFQLVPDKKKHAITSLKLELDKFVDPVVMQPMQLSKTSNKEKKTMHLTNSLDEIFDVPNDENDIQQIIEKTELDRYLEDETKIDNKMNILTYWDLNKSLYPNLARVAKRILAIPATNTTIERLFSDSGNTVTDRRTRLDSDNINYLLFVMHNMKILKEVYPTVIEVC